MNIEEVQHSDIRKGDFIVRISQYRDEIFTLSGVAHHEETLPLHVPGVVRHYWETEDRAPIAYVDRDTGEDMQYHPEGIEKYIRVTA